MKYRNPIMKLFLIFALFFSFQLTVNAENMTYSDGGKLESNVTMLYGGKYKSILNTDTAGTSKPSYGTISNFNTGVTVEGATEAQTLRNVLLGFGNGEVRSFVIKNALKYNGKYYDTKTTITGTRGDSFAYFHRTDKFLTSQIDVRKYANLSEKKIPLNNPNNASVGLVGNNISNCAKNDSTNIWSCTKILPVEIDLKVDIYEAGTNKHASIPNLIVGLIDIDWGGGFYLPEGLNKDNAIIVDKAGDQDTDIDQLYYNSDKKVVYSEIGPTNGTDTYEVANVYWKSDNARKKGSFEITYGYRQAAGVYLNFGVLEGLPEKKYADDTPSGKNNAAVKVGDTIKYSINYTNGHSSQSAKVVVTDILSKGLTYIEGSSKIGNDAVEPKITKNDNGTTTLVWTRDSVPANTKEVLTYSAKVEDGVAMVSNNAIVNIGDSQFTLDPLVNPIPSKEYASDTPSGMNGSLVATNDTIKYSIKFANIKDNKSTVKIVDVISKGLEYVPNSSKIGDESIEPSVSKNSDGSTSLVWLTEINPKTDTNLTYSVKVTGDTSVVINNASIQFDNGPIIDLNQLKNPLKEDYILKSIETPNTASPVVIAVVILGILLVLTAVYFVLKNYNLINFKK